MFVAFLKILKKHDRITGSHIRRKFCLETLNHMDFVLYGSTVNKDAKYCLSLLKRIPDPNMRSGTHDWSYQDRKLLMCRVIVNHPSDRHHQRQRIHLPSSDEYSRTEAIPPLAATTASTSQQQRWRLQLHQGCEGSKGCQPYRLQHCELHMEQRVRGGAI